MSAFLSYANGESAEYSLTVVIPPVARKSVLAESEFLDPILHHAVLLTIIALTDSLTLRRLLIWQVTYMYCCC
ncbi:MAG: hypothetical protein K0S79_1826 [Nitrospira sp.]|nr:hypothetical protein [Nitrospira sp.]